MHVYVYVCIYVYIHTYTYTCIYIYIHYIYVVNSEALLFLVHEYHLYIICRRTVWSWSRPRRQKIKIPRNAGRCISDKCEALLFPTKTPIDHSKEDNHGGSEGNEPNIEDPKDCWGGGGLATLVVLKLCCFLYSEDGAWWLEKDQPDASWRSFLGLEPKEEKKALPDGSEPVQACCVRCASNPIWLSLLLC